MGFCVLETQIADWKKKGIIAVCKSGNKTWLFHGYRKRIKADISILHGWRDKRLFFFSDSDVHLMQLQTNEDKLPRIHIRYNSLKINYNEGS